MVEPLLDAHTEWIEDDDGKRLQWSCPECSEKTYTERRFATKRCSGCNQIMQAGNFDVDPQNPDPQNPESFLKELARRRGFPYDYYFPDDGPEAEDPLEW